MAKAVAAADLWRYRTGQGQDLSLDLRRVPHRLCPFYDQKWELLNGYPPGAPGDPTNPFMPTYMYPTRDGRWIQLLNTYPKAKTRALAFLDCADNYPAIEAVTRTWNSFDLEEQANRHGLQATVVRSTEEFLELDQFRHLAAMPLVTIEKIADSAPEPLGPHPTDPAGRCPGPRPRARHRRRRPGPRPGLPRRRRPEHLAPAGLRDRHRLLHLQRRHAFRHHRFRPNPGDGTASTTDDRGGRLLREPAARLPRPVRSHRRGPRRDPARDHSRRHVPLRADRALERPNRDSTRTPVGSAASSPAKALSRSRRSPRSSWSTTTPCPGSPRWQ